MSDILHGIAARPGVAIAVAARLHDDFGVPSLAPERLRRLGERLRSYGIENPEPEQIIVVADRIPPAFWLAPIPGVQVVGLAAAHATPLVPPPDLPVVLGLDEAALASIEEDDILIVDGDRGRLYVAPDAATVARYQAPFLSTRRFFLEGSHLPARTASDNRLITVLCSARTLAEAEEAMKSGADGLVVPEGNDFLGSESLPQTAGEQAQMLGDLAQIIGGQPLTLDIPPERLALTALARGAARLPLHLVLRDWEELADLQERIEEIEAALEQDDALFGRVKLEAGIEASGTGVDASGTGVDASGDGDALPESLDGFAGVFVAGSILDASWDRLLPLSGQARRAGKPVTVALDGDWWPQVLGDAVGMGFSRLIVPADAVADVKDAVREL